MKGEAKLGLLLKELLKTEESFTKNAQIIQSIFQKLHQHYPEERVFEQYDLYLKRALPIYEKIWSQAQLISQNFTLNTREKINQITTLYSSDLYTHSFSNFILFYRQFEYWGGEVEYEKWIQKSHLFSSKIMKDVYEKYTPMIFAQRLSQLSMIIHECSIFMNDPKVQSVDKLIRTTAKEMNEKRIKIEVVSDMAHLLARVDEEGFENDQKKLVQLFIENQLYQDVEFHEVNEKIKKYFIVFCHEILLNLCKQIEELKMKLSENSSEELIEFNEELKARLSCYLIYAKSESLDDHSMFRLADAVLADNLLTSADHKKLLLMRGFVDSFSYTQTT